MITHYDRQTYILTLNKGDKVLNLLTNQVSTFSHSISPSLCSSKCMVYLEGSCRGIDSSLIDPLVTGAI